MSFSAMRVVSLLSESASPGLRNFVAWWAAATGLPLVLDESAPWTDRARWAASGEVDVAFVCGLLCSRDFLPKMEIVAAPVMEGARYNGQPIYFSDVIVRRDAPFQQFEDLKGSLFGFNDPGSWSGHAAVGFHLQQRGEGPDFFSQWVETGSHLASVNAVVDGTVDAAAIDSTVLDSIPASGLRVVSTLGPNPVPPVAFAASLMPAVRNNLRERLVHAHETPEGQRALRAARIHHFVRTDANPYQVLLQRAVAARSGLP